MRTPSKPVALLGLALGFAAGCSNESAGGGPADPPPTSPDGGTGEDAGPSPPFKSFETAANAPEAFSQTRCGVPLPDGSVAFLATVEGVSEEEATRNGSRTAVWLQPRGGAPRVLYVGDKIVSPFDIEASVDGNTLYIADVAGGAEGRGALHTLSSNGGEPTEVLSGYAPRGVTVSSKGSVYFTGIDEASGEPGVFVLAGSAATRLHVGAPFVDPSGIAIFEDGRVLVSDTRLFEGDATGGATKIGSEAGIVLVQEGQASIFATGFITGYPAGIALTADEKSLIVSGQAPDRSDTVYIVDVANPKAPPTVVTDKFSAFQDSSGGLKRAHDSNTFIWASLAADRGTVYRIEAK